MKTCGSCTRHLRVAESRCPFCGAQQRTASAPLWVGLVCVSALATTPIACTEEPPCVDGVMTVKDESGAQHQVACGNDTIGDDDYGEGSTYAGPDESFTVTSPDSGPWPDSETTFAESSSGSESSSTGCAQGCTTESGSSESSSGSESGGSDSSGSDSSSGSSGGSSSDGGGVEG